MGQRDLEVKSDEELAVADAEHDRALAISLAKSGAPAAVRRLQQIMYTSDDKTARMAAADLLKAAKVMDTPSANTGAPIQIAAGHINLLVSTLAEIQEHGR